MIDVEAKKQGILSLGGVALQRALEKLQGEFFMSKEEISNIAANFQNEIALSLMGKNSSLKMLKSFLKAPTGRETGHYLALDFGGSNVRSSLVKLSGDSLFLEKYKIVKPLKDPETMHDLRSEQVTAEELFDFLAVLIEKVVSQLPDSSYGLGYSFSFPYEQLSINQAVLTNWDKEVRTSGVEGKDVGVLLMEALNRKGLGNRVLLKAIINDTVGTLLSAGYKDQEADIGSIIGTGHNTCYIEPSITQDGSSMIVNTESGNFSKARKTFYDEVLDRESDNPGEQGLEKMVSGKYLGELFRIICKDFVEKDIMLKGILPDFMDKPYQLSSKDMGVFLADNTSELSEIKEWLTERKVEVNLNDRRVVKKISEIVSLRSARLAAATYLGILSHIDPLMKKKHTIAIDGSLYEGLSGYADNLKKTLVEVNPATESLAALKLTQGGSRIGAAVAAALAEKKSR